VFFFFVSYFFSSVSQIDHSLPTQQCIFTAPMLSFLKLSSMLVLIDVHFEHWMLQLLLLSSLFPRDSNICPKGGRFYFFLFPVLIPRRRSPVQPQCDLTTHKRRSVELPSSLFSQQPSSSCDRIGTSQSRKLGPCVRQIPIDTIVLSGRTKALLAPCCRIVGSGS
jgi:hypothetical protein